MGRSPGRLVLALAVIGGCLAGVFGGAGASGQTTPLPALPTPAPATPPPSTTGLVNCQTAPDQITKNAFGETVHHWQLGGHTLQRTDPPAGVDPTKATVAELTRWGYPLYAGPTGDAVSDAKSLAEWRTMLHGRFSQDAPCMSSDMRAGIGGHNDGSGGNWSGVQNTTNPNYMFTWVEGTWNQTGWRNSTCPHPQGFTTWTGLGGWRDQNGAHPLLQAGTINGLDAPNQILPFLELVDANNNGPIFYLSTNGIVAGHRVFSRVAYDPSRHLAAFWVVDQSVGNVYYYAEEPNAQPWFYGVTAQYIEERPLFNGGPVDLREWYYHTEDWFTALARTGDGNTYHAGAMFHTLLWMVGPEGARLATLYNDVTTDQSWTNHWQYCV